MTYKSDWYAKTIKMTALIRNTWVMIMRPIFKRFSLILEKLTKPTTVARRHLKKYDKKLDRI